MSGDLLQTKLYVPQLRPSLVPRPHLIKKLNQSLQQGSKLTLISAPAGFGKTTLVSAWMQQIEQPATWLSLDENDNDLTRFLTYCIAALNRIEGQALSEAEGIDAVIGEGALGMLQSPHPTPTEVVLTSLINDIDAIPDRIIFVLDDYHVIESQPIDETLTFLLEHLPPQMHLVIATREDPTLPLARLRVRGQLTELRAVDLCFTDSEAATFLNQVMGLNLSVEEIAALERRTEGWIAGLQMAAISMQGSKDTAGFISDFIAAFTGSHRFVLDYLVEEVLDQLPKETRRFLLQTSILDRLSGPLCNAVTGQENGKKMLETLERSNLFVVPLDDQRHWYRYHHLFADVLQARLMDEQSNQSPTLHRRASDWYEQNGLRSDAIQQAFAADDFERAADLTELAWQAMDSSFQSATWLGWVKKLPDKLIRARPVLSTQYADALWMGGDLEASESRLRDAERWLEGSVDGNSPFNEFRASSERNRRMVVVDEDQFRTLPARIAIIRTQNALAQRDVAGAVNYAELALKLTPEDDLLGRAQTTVSLGLAYWASGDLKAAHRSIANWINSMQKAGNVVFAIASAFALADIMVAQGRLREAVRAYQHSLGLASEQDKQAQRITAHHHLGLAMLYHEMGDQEAAAQRLQKSRELGKQSPLIDWPYRHCLAQARLKEAGGELEAALDLLDEAKRVYVRNLVPDSRPVAAWKARVYIRQGRLAKALDWVRERGLSVDDNLSYLREFEYITLARVFIAKAGSPNAQDKSDRAERSLFQAIGLLERLLKAAEEGGRMGSVIEILTLQALAYQAQGNIPLALGPLERALTLAEPEGYVRLFVDEGVPMTRLLSEAVAHEIMPDYTGKLLAAFEGEDQQSEDASYRPLDQPLIEPLSQRELEVLQLIAAGLSNREISERLFVALNTVKGHNRNIFGKLQVQRRTEAVAQARELGLL